MKEKRVVFKRYGQNQPTLLPPSLDELVPERHPVRVVNEVLERIDIGALERSYKGGGASSYHPRMLLKVLVYAYLRNIYARKNWPGKLREYEQKEKLLAGRKSLSKTDPDASFMRMKEDHMRNGQLKPGYNVQAFTTGHYILNYTLGQTTSDTSLLKDHIEDYIEAYASIPESLTADAGYGSEEELRLS